MPAKIISFINMKGGVAKSTLLVNVADFLSRREGRRVLIIDVDPQFNATQMLISPQNYIRHLQDGRNTILDVFDRSRRIVSSVVGGAVETTRASLDDMEVYEINPHLKILPGNIELFRVEMASGEGRENLLKRYVEVVKEDYDFILIDTPPTPSVWMTSALIASDYYLIPVKPDPISFTGIDLLKSVIDGRQETYGLRLKCLGVVLTIVEEGTINFSEARNKLAGDAVWGRYLFRSHLSKRVIISREQGNQKTILELDDLDAKASMAGIVRELLSRLT